MTDPATARKGPATSWCAWTQLGADAPTGPLADLMRRRGSMTAALRELCQQRFDLRVCREGHRSFEPYQVGELQAREGLLREVLMSCDAQPWVFAQSLIPATTLASNHWLGRLGGQPLGDELFQRNDVTRSQFVYARITPGTALHASVSPLLEVCAASVWARRSFFTIGAHPLLVNELFLPGLTACPVR